jgi:uncharacterized protein YecT (DUF1311 family)
MNRYLMAFFLGIAAAGVARADDSLLSQSYRTCMDRSEGVTMKVMDCIRDESQLQDGRLNATYKKLMDSLSPERRQQLRSAQRLWIKYRDANCAFYLDPEGGSMARMDAGFCMLDMMAKRTKELERFLN